MRRGSRFSRLISLLASKREKRSCQSSRVWRVVAAAAVACTGRSGSATTTVQRPPKQLKRWTVSGQTMSVLSGTPAMTG